MIINRPTGLYAAYLPRTPENVERRNVIYTISGDIPIFRVINQQRITEGVRHAAKPPKIYNQLERRDALGDLVFVESDFSEADAKYGQPSYSFGEVLDFTEDLDDDVTPNFSGGNVVIQHNLDRLDSESIGIDDADEMEISSAAREAYNNILEELKQLQVDYDVLSTSIDTDRKYVSEIDKAVSGLDVILEGGEDTSISSIRQELVERRTILESVISDNVNLISLIPFDIATAKDKLRSLSIFIK